MRVAGWWAMEMEWVCVEGASIGRWGRGTHREAVWVVAGW